MVIQHNLAAMNSQRQLGIVNNRKAKSTEKLSSGYRINRAADDAAGLAISEKMRRQIRGLTQASENAQDGISLVQIADGALNEVHDMLHRCSELAIKAANDTMTTSDRTYIQAEINQIKEEINKTAERTTYNEIPVLRGGGTTANYTIIGNNICVGKLPDWVSSPSFGAGHYAETNGAGKPCATIDFSGVTSANIQELYDTGFSTDCATCDNFYSIRFVNGTPSDPVKQSGSNYVYNVDISGATSGADVVSAINRAVGTTPGGHYTQIIPNGDSIEINDVRGKGADFNSGVVIDIDDIDNLGIPVYDLQLQVGAEQYQTIDIRLANISTDFLGITDANVLTNKATWGTFVDEAGNSHSGWVGGQCDKAIESFKGALSYVSKERSRMGAYQNRLEHTIRNLDNVVENTTAAESLIRDTDMATEMVAFSKDNILGQVGQSMLAQANQSKQGILSLLS